MNQNNLTFQLSGRNESSRFKKLHNITYNNVAETSALVAKEIANGIRNCKSEYYLLGLATGSSSTGVYKELVRLHREEKLTFKNVVTFNLDECFGLKREDKNSYNSFMHTHLFDHINLPKDQIYIPDGSLSEKEVSAYYLSYEEKTDKVLMIN